MSDRAFDPPRIEDLEKEVNYLRRLAGQTASRVLTQDIHSIAMWYELEQKRRGFRLMAELAITLGQEADYGSVFASVSRRVNATLNMRRTVILLPEAGGLFKAKVLQGYSTEDCETIASRRIDVPPEFHDLLNPVIVTGADPAERYGSFRESLMLPYLISAPVMLKDRVAGFLVAGRLLEQPPYSPRLGKSDAESVQMVSAYLAATIASHLLHKVENLAKHDPLTQLPNLRGSTEQMGRVLAIARRGGFFFATMFIDLDGFKLVNDTYGHAAGDVVLRIVSERLSGCMRGSDFVGRIGGDEFLVVLSHIKRPGDAEVVVRKLLERLAEPICIGSVSAKIGASIGIAIFPDDGNTESELIQAADKAMYGVKNRGKGSFAFAGK